MALSPDDKPLYHGVFQSDFLGGPSLQPESLYTHEDRFLLKRKYLRKSFELKRI
jgi:hypothetical protein